MLHQSIYIHIMLTEHVLAFMDNLVKRSDAIQYRSINVRWTFNFNAAYMIGTHSRRS